MEDYYYQKKNDLSSMNTYLNVGTNEGLINSTTESPFRSIQTVNSTRIHYLWSKLRAAVRTAMRLRDIRNEIHLFGTNPGFNTMVQDYRKQKTDNIFRPYSSFKLAWAYFLLPFLF